MSRKEKISTVHEDYNLHVKKDMNKIVKENIKNIIEKNFTQRIKGTKTEFVEQDVKVKYLQNLFQQVGKNFRLDINKAYSLDAKTIKYNVDNLELIANAGVSLKVGGSVLTVDGSGIHMKAPNVDTSSSNSGVSAKSVPLKEQEEISHEAAAYEIRDIKKNIKDKQTRVKDLVTGVVFFRPDNKYKGEYGFDWLRQKETSYSKDKDYSKILKNPSSFNQMKNDYHNDTNYTTLLFNAKNAEPLYYSVNTNGRF